MTVSRADFTFWLEHPVTEWVLAAVSAEGEALKADWIAASWDGGTADPLELTRLRASAAAYATVVQPSYEALCVANGQEVLEE